MIDEMRRCLPLKKDVIYGPVHSRRLGESLGINLSPISRKICPFNCVYCHYGWSSVVTLNSLNYESEFADPREICQSLENYLQENPKPDYVTFSGNGEPSSHPRFDEIVARVVEIRDRLAPGIKTTILSNSTTAGNPKIISALRLLDLCFMKLDCGDEETFLRFNRPASGITLSGIINDLANLNMPIIIQTLIANGAGGNFNEKNLCGFVEGIAKINPQSIQLYSLDRPTPDGSLIGLAEKQLEHIGVTVCGETGVPFEVFGPRPKPVQT